MSRNPATRHSNSNRGRMPMQFTSRKCKDCKEICPADQFKVRSNRTRCGYTLRRRCASCERRYQRIWKATRRADDEKRLADNIRRRGYRTNGDPDYSSLWQWVRYRMKRWESLGAYPCVVFLVPTTVATPNAKPGLGRRWVGLTWAFREDRVGILPPLHGIPFVRLSRQVVIKHPCCPDGWDLAVRITKNRLRLMFPPEEGE